MSKCFGGEREREKKKKKMAERDLVARDNYLNGGMDIPACRVLFRLIIKTEKAKWKLF